LQSRPAKWAPDKTEPARFPDPVLADLFSNHAERPSYGPALPAPLQHRFFHHKNRQFFWFFLVFTRFFVNWYQKSFFLVFTRFCELVPKIVFFSVHPIL